MSKMLFTFFPYMSINNLSIRSMVCYPSHLYYMELELVQIILHFHFNSVDGVTGYICIIFFYTPIETSVNKKQLQHVSMLVIAEECEGSWKQPWEVWEHCKTIALLVVVFWTKDFKYRWHCGWCMQYWCCKMVNGNTLGVSTEKRIHNKNIFLVSNILSAFTILNKNICGQYSISLF